MSDKVVLRFAPSPTGPLHIGGVRTAWFNYLFAKKYNGTLILRIEDTDQTRFVPGAEAYIKESLEWAGIQFDEGVDEGGPNGPYRQSERQHLYRQYADQLVAEGKAYLAFDTPEEIEAMRENLKAKGHKMPTYNYVTRNSMSNSLTLAKEEVEAKVAAGVPYVIRMRIPRKEEIRFHDQVRQWVVVHSNQLDDKVLLKSDGLPTYHLANVVDDHLMGITHVIRGEEWLPSTPLHVLLYRAFGWEDQMPTFAHLPLILKPEGKGKLSKRDGDKYGFPVFPIDWKSEISDEMATGFRESGYLPEALTNFLALLGWSPGNDEELMTTERMIEAFSLDRIQKGGASFNIDKLKSFNQAYLRNTADEDFLPVVRKNLEDKSGEWTDAFLLQAISIMKERVQFPQDLVHAAPFLYEKPTTFDQKMHRKRWKPEGKEYLRGLLEKWDELTSWESPELESTFDTFITDNEIGKGKVLAPLRLALTGAPSGPGVFDIAALIGKEDTFHRIKYAIENLEVVAA
ncbi:MAG: glutamate--tRNA ligase [Bacteroidota bacterium]